MTGVLETFQDWPLLDEDLEKIRERKAVHLAQGGVWRWIVEWDRDYAMAIVVVTTSRNAGLSTGRGSCGWTVAWSDEFNPDEDPQLLFIVAQEARGSRTSRVSEPSLPTRNGCGAHASYAYAMVFEVERGAGVERCVKCS